ncbi:unnamed protein product [Rotaria sordida]|uniref:AIG1-type G domain-containing protein n=1 Tax=Rotaria sordida TaxID=392033 RepID=A0A813YIU7_9BILA|nr:unnamed protein product [Rotaria sordida]CAF0884659.1 unnamed protein product [Rotaria sordida]
MATKNLKIEKGNFLWFRLFVEVLIHMKDNARAHHDLVEILRMNYPQSNFVADFNQNYTADKAIEWLTRDDSCLLKELNRALRQQHLDHLFVFRYVINDIHQQLKTEHDKEIKDKEKTLTLYRSQVISEFELSQLLQANTGELIAINSFMSTWSDRMKAIDFHKEQHHVGLKHILFEIEVDYTKKSRPFAQIYGKEQDLTLFMLGCVFRIRSIMEDHTFHCYVMKIELCSDDDCDLKNIFDHMTKDFIQPETDLITLGSLLHRMGELDKARKYFQLLLHELDENDPDRAHCFDGLGHIENDQGRFREALKYYQQALNLRMSHNSSHTNHSLIALSHIHIANDYKDMGDYNEALQNVEKARTFIRQQNLQEDRIKEAACHIIMGSILYEKAKCIEALDEFQQALDINKQQGIPDDHPDRASIFQNMGLCHLTSGTIIHNPTLALDYCVQALIIRLNTLPQNHRCTGITYRSIGLAYEQLKEYQSALKFYKEANIIHKALNKTFNELQKTENDIKRIQKHLSDPMLRPTHQFKTQSSQNEAPADIGAIKFKTERISPQLCSTEVPIQVVTRRMILLGRSNEVKSSFGDALLAQDNYFMINQGSSSVTYTNESSHIVGFRDFYGRKLMIVDTPAFANEYGSNSIIRTKITHSLEQAAPGPHAFLFVLEFTPELSFSEEDDKKLCEFLISIFGPTIYQYIVFVFTNLEKLQRAGIEIDRYLKQRCSQTFINLMKRCKNRYIPIDNRAPPNAKDASFAELLLIIDRMLNENQGKEYTYQSSSLQQTLKFTTQM